MQKLLELWGKQLKTEIIYVQIECLNFSQELSKPLAMETHKNDENWMMKTTGAFVRGRKAQNAISYVF